MNFINWLKGKCSELYNKIVGEKASEGYIARGWAIGMFWGCICPFGFQLLCSIPTSFLLKGSKVGATLGTLITNHFSIFVIYPLQTYVGALILGSSISYGQIKLALKSVFKEQSYDALLAMGSDLVLAFLLGGFLLSMIMTPLTYFVVKYIVQRYRKKNALTKQISKV